MTTPFVQGDPFCPCGRNLHGLPLARDGRTGLWLAECPECGAFHAGGAADTAVTQWAARFYTALVLAWAAALLLLAAAAAGVQFYLNLCAAMEIFFTKLAAQYPGSQWSLLEQIVFLLFTLAFGGALGGLQAVALWHVRWPAKLGPILCALAVAAALAALTLHESPRFSQPGDFATANLIVLGVSGVTFLGWAVMLYLGRPLARVVASIAVPPRPRRALAFLWTADGLTPPADEAP